MKRSTSLLIAIFLVAITFMIGMNAVSASVRFADCKSVHYTSKYYQNVKVGNANLPYSNDNSYSAIYKTSNNRVVYCLELGRTLVSSRTGAPSESYKTVDATSGKYLWDARVIGYGYNGNSGASDKCSSKRIATQMLVHMIHKQGTSKDAAWRTYSKSKIRSFFNSKTSSSKKDSIAKAFVDIRNNALSTTETPSFEGKTVTLTYDISEKKWIGTVTDKNKTLSTWWSVSDKGGLSSVTKSGNKLTLVAKNNNTKSGTIKLKRTVPSSKIHVSTYTKDKQQTVYVDAGTKTIYVKFKYKLASVNKGTITVVKKDSYSNEEIAGATYGIFSNSSCTTKAKDYAGTTLNAKTTDESGTVSWSNLYYENSGTKYYVKETKVPEGYVISESDLAANKAVNGCIPVTINSTAHAVKKTFVNNPYGDIEILKLNSETLQKLEGITFRLFDENGANVATDINGKGLEAVTTDANGIAKWEKVPYGKYVIKEISENSSYYKDGFYLLGSEDQVLRTSIEFTLNSETDAVKIALNGENTNKQASIELVNVPIDVKISKREIGGSEEVPGAKIVIKDSDGKVIEEYTSTNEEKIMYLATGEYSLTETVAPDGYKNLKTVVNFKIDKNGKVTITSAESNMYKIEKSEDGDYDHLIIYNELIKKKAVPVPNTASTPQIIGLVGGVLLLSIGGYVVYRKFNLPHEGKK